MITGKSIGEGVEGSGHGPNKVLPRHRLGLSEKITRKIYVAGLDWGSNRASPVYKAEALLQTTCSLDL
jgi:hypothetical protein